MVSSHVATVAGGTHTAALAGEGDDEPLAAARPEDVARLREAIDAAATRDRDALATDAAAS